MLQTGNIFNRLETGRQKISHWLGITPKQVLFLILSLPLSIVVPFAAGVGLKMDHPVAAILIWLLSIIFVLAGGFSRSNVRIRPEQTTLLWIEILLVTTFVVRSLSADRLPIILHGDEASAGLDAMQFVGGERDNIFIVGYFSFPSLYHFIQSLSIRIFGQTTFALRVPSTLIGAFTVVLLYLVGKKMFNPRAGLLAAISLAALHLHMHFSRLGINNIWDAFWYLLVIGALWIGWKHEDRRAYIIAGAGLGLSQYFYITSRALFMLLLVSIVLAFRFEKEKLRRALPHLVVMGLVALVLFLPLIVYYLKYPHEYFAPLHRVSLFGEEMDYLTQATGFSSWKIFTTQISTAFKGYTSAPIISYYNPEIPVLQPMAAFFFNIGILMLIHRYRDERLVLLAIWLGIIGLIGGLSNYPPSAQRYVAATPACALLIGVGLDGSAKILLTRNPKATRFINASAFLAAMIMMASDFHFYFVKYSELSMLENTHSNGMIAQRLADQLKGKPKETQVFFLGTPDLGYHYIPSISYLAPQVIGIDIYDPWYSSNEKPSITSDPAIFVFLQERENEIQAVQNDYPDGLLTVERAWNGDPLFWLYEVHVFQ